MTEIIYSIEQYNFGGFGRHAENHYLLSRVPSCMYLQSVDSKNILIHRSLTRLLVSHSLLSATLDRKESPACRGRSKSEGQESLRLLRSGSRPRRGRRVYHRGPVRYSQPTLQIYKHTKLQGTVPGYIETARRVSAARSSTVGRNGETPKLRGSRICSPFSGAV
ncbi:hypothetical protein RRG08_066262 [Elysia crispata]|uniref:Uncharacterized protein n=1 Tax=Elysia crispata TaxID=231223 RepID=A0AAE1BEJ9_9GAST|nr:hypothetical protein RRG08_066262 [Elysia crispata]